MHALLIARYFFLSALLLLVGGLAWQSLFGGAGSKRR